ncbi:hypothetical protein ACFYW8_28385 [Streptomyces sp. NPDC002742]|uniref:hypothetical protein n=1 Tax=Streptomyces sp. NPDC002742 TaxID=3364663 RepID=UPI0036A0C833
MSEIGTTEVCAAGRRGGGGSPYAYRVRGLGRSAVVLWIGGAGDEPDQVLALPDAGHRRVPVFVTVRQARVYVSRHGRKLAVSEAGVLELTRVQHWLADPVRRHVSPGAVLDAWNFFEDLARGLGEVHRLPRQGALHNSAYEKLFGDESDAWTPGERHAVLELLTAGVELWNSCPVTVKPRSSPVPDSGRGSPRGW